MADFFDRGKGYGIQLDEYNGKYKLLEANEGKDGKIYPQWAKVQIGKEEKNRPMGVYLGDLDSSITLVENILTALKELRAPF